MSEYEDKLIERLMELPKEQLLEIIRDNHKKRELCKLVLDKFECSAIEKLLEENGI